MTISDENADLSLLQRVRALGSFDERLAEAILAPQGPVALGLTPRRLVAEAVALLGEILPAHRLLVRTLAHKAPRLPGVTYGYVRGERVPVEQIESLVHHAERADSDDVLNEGERVVAPMVLDSGERVGALVAEVLVGSGRFEAAHAEALSNVSCELGRRLRALRTHTEARRWDRVRSTALLTRGLVHDLNNLRASLFPNLDCLSETLGIWARVFGPLERLVRASIHVPELRPYAEEIRNLVEEEELEGLVEDTPELLTDLQAIRSRFRELVERLEHVSSRNKGLIVEEDLEQTLARVIAEATSGVTPLPTIEVHCAAPLQVFTYRQILHRCVREIVLNAIEAAGEGGRVDITLERAGDQWVAIHVRDDGPGMSVDEQRAAFQPFHTTKRQKVQGGGRRGLGLTAAVRTALQLGGEVGLSSRASVGTTATLWLPDPKLDGRTVLALGRFPESALEVLEGAQVVACLGEDVLACLGDERPELVVLASSYPPQSALDELRTLRERFPALPVLRYGIPATMPGWSREAEDALDRLVQAEVDDAECLRYEVRRLLTRVLTDG